MGNSFWGAHTGTKYDYCHQPRTSLGLSGGLKKGVTHKLFPLFKA